jgi:hypothetical protein
MEPLATTLRRNFTIAIVAGAVLTLAVRHDLKWWPMAALVMLWPSLGGHYVEELYLNQVRPRFADARVGGTIVRVILWFVAGCFFAWAMHRTASGLVGASRLAWPWWIGGLGFIGVELIAHAGLQARRRPSIYNGLG